MKSDYSQLLNICLIGIVLLLALLFIIQYTHYNYVHEDFESQTPVKVHYYWIMSDKRKPMMLEQLKNRKSSTLSNTMIDENSINIIPGIFDDNVEQTLHPKLPKEWLGFPVARLLAAHMKALRMFKNEVDNLNDKKKHVFVCMEDDIVLRHNFEEIVNATADVISKINKPTRVALGYASPPKNKNQTNTLYDEHTISKLGSLYGDPWGTLCYMMNYSFATKALSKYEDAYRKTLPDTKKPNDVASDVFMFDIPNTQHMIIEPPAAIEDTPTFDSLLGHTNQNMEHYNKLIKTYDRSKYYIFNQ